MIISPDVQLSRWIWADEGRLTVPSSIYPRSSAKQEGLVLRRWEFPREHAKCSAVIKRFLTAPCGCLKSRRRLPANFGALVRATRHLEGSVRRDIRVGGGSGSCSSSEWKERKTEVEKKQPCMVLQNQKSHSLRVQPSFSADCVCVALCCVI